MRALLTLVLGVLLFAAATPSWAATQDRRVALVIGNSGYRKFPPLPNPKNDAEDVSVALKKLGFTVIGGPDLTREAMRDGLRQFARAAQDAEAALVFYAGHGLQYRGRNYLVPIDAKLEDEFDLEYETVRVDDVVEELTRADGARILILDACRNLPLSARGRDPFSSTGLAKLSGRGLIVAYATQANQVAYDGTGRNSIFTGAFVKAVQEPGLDVTQLFQRVSMNVDKVTGGRQTPELSLSYPGQFYFNKGETEREAWPRARASGDPEILRDFIAKYPTSFLVDDAKDLIARLEAQRAGGVASRPATVDNRAPPLQVARRPEDEARAKEDAERLAWQKLQDEQKRRAEARQQAEQQRAAEEARDKQRLAQDAKQDEERKRIEARRLELERVAEEARQKKLAEERAVAETKERQRLAQEARAEEERRRQEARRADQERVAEEARQKKLAEDAATAEARERQRVAAEARAEEARQRKLAEDAAASEARERQRLAAEGRAEEERRRQEARRAEQERLAEDARQRKFAEEAAALDARQRAAEERRQREQFASASVPASGADMSQEERDRLAWQALEEQQRRRAQGAASVTAEAAPEASEGSVQTTLAAVKAGVTASVPSGGLQPGTGSGPQAMDRPASQPIRLALNDPSRPLATEQPPVAVAPVEAFSRDKLVRDTQAELGRIGCYDEMADGSWDKDSRDALRRFGRLAKLSPVPSDPTPSLLEDLKGRPEKFCPLECGAGEKSNGEQCVAVARPDPKPVERKAKPRAVVQERREPAPQIARPRPAPAPAQAPAPVASAPRPATRAVMGVGF